LPKVAIHIVRYNQELPLLETSIRAALNQTFDDFTVTLTENGSDLSLEDAILALFGDHPKFRYRDNKRNLGFAGAHNKFFLDSESEFVIPLNPDTVMSPDYVCKLLRVFSDPRIAAAEGKMLKPDRDSTGSWILDGTGMVISRSRRARERGHLEIDNQQYDGNTDIFGVSATAAAYRMSALDEVKFEKAEYFDEDFFTYWEDLDLSWRLRLAGFACAYVPAAIIFHSRFAAQSKSGFRKPWDFVRHTRRLPTRVICWDWRNHLFAIIKNDFGWNLYRDLPWIVTRELLLFCYLVIVEPSIIMAVPEFVRLMPRILEKRRMVQRKRVATSTEMAKWFGHKHFQL
jgi:GT2 family glycosyltransferase